MHWKIYFGSFSCQEADMWCTQAFSWPYKIILFHIIFSVWWFSIFINFLFQVDTAGWLQRTKDEKGPSSLSIVQSRKSIMRAQVVALVLDAEEVCSESCFLSWKFSWTGDGYIPVIKMLIFSERNMLKLIPKKLHSLVQYTRERKREGDTRIKLLCTKFCLFVSYFVFTHVRMFSYNALRLDSWSLLVFASVLWLKWSAFR